MLFNTIMLLLPLLQLTGPDHASAHPALGGIPRQLAPSHPCERPVHTADTYGLQAVTVSVGHQCHRGSNPGEPWKPPEAMLQQAEELALFGSDPVVVHHYNLPLVALPPLGAPKVEPAWREQLLRNDCDSGGPVEDGEVDDSEAKEDLVVLVAQLAFCSEDLQQPEVEEQQRAMVRPEEEEACKEQGAARDRCFNFGSCQV